MYLSTVNCDDNYNMAAQFATLVMELLKELQKIKSNLGSAGLTYNTTIFVNYASCYDGIVLSQCFSDEI